MPLSSQHVYSNAAVHTAVPELSCTCCCQSSQIQSRHSHPSVLALAKNNRAHCTQAHFTYLQSSHNHPTFITVQPPRSTRSSSLVRLAHPSTSSSLRITDRSFHYASPRLRNQFPTSLRQPRTNLSNSDSPSLMRDTSSIGCIDSQLSSSITPSHFHPSLKPSFSANPSHRKLLLLHRD